MSAADLPAEGVVAGRWSRGLEVELEHPASGARLATDATLADGGGGGAFSPTDLLAAALGSCVLTAMAMVARREGIEPGELRFRCAKRIAERPRRVAALELTVWLPTALTPLQRRKLERAARACTVSRTLAGAVAVAVELISPG